MQTYAETIREDAWGKLRTIFQDVTGGKDVITVDQIVGVLNNTLKITEDDEIQYVTRNLFRLDTDNNGKIDFPEFANFLLKRHCGEHALRRRHKKAHAIQHAAARKLTSKEFTELLEDSYSFLGVKVDQAEIAAIFKDQIKGTDGLMTYVEYFTFIERWICKSKAELVEPPKPTKTYISRLRSLLWLLLRRLYDKYDKDHNEKLDEKEITALIREVLQLYSSSEIEFVLVSIFHMEAGDSISFNTFASNFLRYLADLGLSRWSLQHPHGERRFQFGDFLIVFRNSFSVLQSHRVSERLLRKFFVKIDTDNDGWISFAQYLQWVKYFLSVVVYNHLDFYIEEDDEALDGGKGWITDETDKVVSPVPASNIVCPYKFSNHDLARRVRAHLFALIAKFDLNKNLTFEETEIINILKVLNKSDDLDIFYVVANVFRYDTDGDKRVTYDELVNFFLELHNGELAIQRLHKKSTYSKGSLYILNQAEFIQTLHYAFSFIEFTATNEELAVLFTEVDLDNDGWISYAEYFQFLRYYFGSLSLVYKEKDNKVVPVEPVDPYAGLDFADRFARITIDQFLLIIKLYRWQPLDRSDLVRFLVTILGLNDQEIDFALINFFRYDIITGGYFLDTDIARILLELYFANIILLRLHRAKKFARWAELLISFEEFVHLVELATGWLTLKHNNALLVGVFKLIDTNGDGFISYREFMAFIRKYLGGRVCNEDFVDPFDNKNDPTEEEFYGFIWTELRALYKHYTKGAHLTRTELKHLVNEVLKEYKKSDMDYIFLNMFRVDPNEDAKIEFEEFAPFILKHAGEIGLRNFHVEQELGKKTLDEAEFSIVVKNAFGFLKSINKSDKILHGLFVRLSNGRGFVTYNEYVGWVFRSIASKVR